MSIDDLRELFPEPAKDLKINLQTVLQSGAPLTTEQRWLVAVATAVACRQSSLREAIVAAAREQAGEAVVEDGIAAAALMAMNNVFYRFRHLVGEESYADKPARLRMQRLARPATSKGDFELASLAVSAVFACQTCVQSHERAVKEAGLTEEHVHEAVRIAATIHGAAVALDAVTEAR